MSTEPYIENEDWDDITPQQSLPAPEDCTSPCRRQFAQHLTDRDLRDNEVHQRLKEDLANAQKQLVAVQADQIKTQQLLLNVQQNPPPPPHHPQQPPPPKPVPAAQSNARKFDFDYSHEIFNAEYEPPAEQPSERPDSLPDHLPWTLKELKKEAVENKKEQTKGRKAGEGNKPDEDELKVVLEVEGDIKRIIWELVGEDKDTGSHLLTYKAFKEAKRNLFQRLQSLLDDPSKNGLAKYFTSPGRWKSSFAIKRLIERVRENKGAIVRAGATKAVREKTSIERTPTPAVSDNREGGSSTGSKSSAPKSFKRAPLGQPNPLGPGASEKSEDESEEEMTPLPIDSDWSTVYTTLQSHPAFAPSLPSASKLDPYLQGPNRFPPLDPSALSDSTNKAIESCRIYQDLLMKQDTEALTEGNLLDDQERDDWYFSFEDEIASNPTLEMAVHDWNSIGRGSAILPLLIETINLAIAERIYRKKRRVEQAFATRLERKLLPTLIRLLFEVIPKGSSSSTAGGSGAGAANAGGPGTSSKSASANGNGSKRPPPDAQTPRLPNKRGKTATKTALDEFNDWSQDYVLGESDDVLQQVLDNQRITKEKIGSCIEALGFSVPARLKTQNKDGQSTWKTTLSKPEFTKEFISGCSPIAADALTDSIDVEDALDQLEGQGIVDTTILTEALEQLKSEQGGKASELTVVGIVTKEGAPVFEEESPDGDKLLEAHSEDFRIVTHCEAAGMFEFGSVENPELSQNYLVSYGACVMVLSWALPILYLATDCRMTARRIWQLCQKHGHNVPQNHYVLPGINYGEVKQAIDQFLLPLPKWELGDHDRIIERLWKLGEEAKTVEEAKKALIDEGGYWIWMSPNEWVLFSQHLLFDSDHTVVR
ncbi:hypothetical protein JCM3765_005903 [Sporobolomyces pararoseus]